MAIQRINLSYDDERHTIVALGLANHADDSHSAYIRKCIEFYEMNKGGAVSQSIIIDKLAAIERMLRNGVVAAADESPDNDKLFDDLLEQLG